MGTQRGTCCYKRMVADGTWRIALTPVLWCVRWDTEHDSVWRGLPNLLAVTAHSRELFLELCFVPRDCGFREAPLAQSDCIPDGLEVSCFSQLQPCQIIPELVKGARVPMLFTRTDTMSRHLRVCSTKKMYAGVRKKSCLQCGGPQVTTAGCPAVSRDKSSRNDHLNSQHCPARQRARPQHEARCFTGPSTTPRRDVCGYVCPDKR